MLNYALADETGAEIRRQREQEAQLQFDAMHDQLTGLPNRGLFLDRLRLTLARVQRRPERRFAVMFLCLDRFRVTTEEIGEDGSNSLLWEITKRLHECLRPEDTVARLEGDEFAVMLDEIRQDRDVYPVAERIQAVLQKPIALDELDAQAVQISGSIGIVIVTSDFQRADDVVQAASLAMDMAKMNGGAQYALAPAKGGAGATIQPCLGSVRPQQLA